MKLPDGLDFDRAAGLTVTYGTTLYALRVRAALQAGERWWCSALPAAPDSPPSKSARSSARASSPAPVRRRTRLCPRPRSADETVNYASEDLRAAFKGWVASAASTWSTTRSAALTPSRRYARSAGKAAISWSASPPAKSRKSAQSGAAQKLRYSRRVMGRMGQARAEGQLALMDRNRSMVRARASSARMSTPSIRWRKPRRR